jgi:hypothetical protein
MEFKATRRQQPVVDKHRILLLTITLELKANKVREQQCADGTTGLVQELGTPDLPASSSLQSRA